MDIEKGHQILQNIRCLNQSKGEMRYLLFSTLFKQTCFVKPPDYLVWLPRRSFRQFHGMGGYQPETPYRFSLPSLRRADACLWHVPNPPKDGQMPGALSSSRDTASGVLAVRKRLRNSIRTDVLEREAPNGPLCRFHRCSPRALRLPACRR